MKNKITEIHIMTNIRLSQVQKFILSKLMLPERTPLEAYSSIYTNKNLVANSKTLIQLGMIIIGNNEAEITDKGIKALRNENLVDDAGNLTSDGEKYAYAESIIDIEKQNAISKNPEEPLPVPNSETGMTGQTAPMKNFAMQPPQSATSNSMSEEFLMIKEAQDILNERKFLKKQKINDV